MHYDRKIYKTCLTTQHIDSLNGFTAETVVWKYKFPQYFTHKFVIDHQCQPEKKIAVVQIMPTLNTSPKIVYYENCPLVLMAACKRQLISVPPPDDLFLDQLDNYMTTTILPELTVILDGFHYSYEVWYNHLTYAQQLEIDAVDDLDLNKRTCDIFCKGEKQQMDGNNMPKNRCISALNAQHKKTMGPVVYALEQYMKSFKGYCGGMNWVELAKCIDDWYKTNKYQVIQSDVSGMDRSVTQRLKEIIHHNIYQLVDNDIHHVSRETWQMHAYPVVTRMNATHYEQGNVVNFGYSTIEGTVFSGSCDTTLMNTLITVILNRYVVERVLGIHPCDYDLKAKGDDSVVVIDKGIGTDTITRAYSQVYYFSKNIKFDYAPFYLRHGCGLALKFLHISQDFDDIDFCSTNCFYCHTCRKHRITRRIDRFVELTPWSNAAINYGESIRAAYKQSLFDSNLTWMRGLPIFTELNNYLYTNNYTKYDLSGKPKRTIPLNDYDQAWYNKMFKPTNDAILRLFGKNEYYSMVVQSGDIQACCAESYVKWLNVKLNLEHSDVLTIINDIQTNYSQYLSPTLTEALSYYHRQREAKHFN